MSKLAIKKAPDGGMVQTEACRPCGTHIFSENVASFDTTHLKLPKKVLKNTKNMTPK